MAHRISKEELDEQFEQFLKESLSDDSFESSKKSAILEAIGNPKIKKSNKKESSPWWPTGDDSDGNTLTNKSFLKSQRTSLPIEEEEEEDEHIEMQHSAQDPVCESMDRDSLDVDDSVVASAPNPVLHGIGLDTLEEQEEKESFFAKFEKGASSTIDYSKLNKELDSTDSTQFTALICNIDKQKSEQNKTESKDLSGNYSEDFEEDAGITDFNKSANFDDEYTDEKPVIKEAENPGMLAKVLLLDSLDSTVDAQKLALQVIPETSSPQGTIDAIDTGVSNAYTNSDFEALHQAYCHLEQSNTEQSLEGSKKETSYLITENQSSASFVDILHSNEKNIKKISTVESDMPTLDELMQPIRRGSASGNDSEVNPVSLLMQTNYRLLQYNDNKASGETAPAVMKEKQTSDYLREWRREKTESKIAFLTSEYRKEKDLIAQETHGDKRIPKGQGYSNFQVEHQDERSSKALLYPHQILSNDELGAPCGRQTSKEKSPTSVLKKSQNAHYAYVKSSGYGKASVQLKQSSLTGNLGSKEFQKEAKGKSPPDGMQKGMLSATRTIRFAESTQVVPKHVRTEISARQPEESVSEMRTNIQQHVSMIILQVNISLRDKGLYMLERLPNVEEKLKSDPLQAEMLKVEFSKKEDECQQKIELVKSKYEEELGHLKQENYILQAKLHSEEEKRKKKLYLLEEIKGPVSEEKMQPIRQEIEEQERLLLGYQQENERLYQKLKELQIRSKQNEENMFKENQHLQVNLMSLREQLNTAAMHCQQEHYDSDFKTRNFAETMAELRVLQKRETSLLDEIARHKQDKQALEVNLAQMRKECDLVKGQLTQISGDKSYEIKVLEETYQQEISRLNKRLQWFAENQELLDRDSKRLRDAYEQIENLKIQVEKLQHETGNQFVQQQNRLKDRAADAKRIQDLERQVKEMETIIKRRHPNSIPALIYAAASAPEIDDTHAAKSNTVTFLEKRIQKLETDLESKDEEAKKSLRSMEQQFQKIKIQYETRINELEGLLAQRLPNKQHQQFDNTTKLKALEQEISICKEAHQTTVMNLHKEIDLLKENNALLERKARMNASSDERLDESSDKAKLTRLNQEVIARSIEVQELSKTVERLQRERMIMLSGNNSSKKCDANKIRSRSKSKADNIHTNMGSTAETNSFPGTLDEKLYQPGTFADCHISDIQQENERLKAELQRLSLEMKEQKANSQNSLSHAKHTIQRLKDEMTEQIGAFKLSHQREIEKIVCQYALEHSSSRVAELSNNISTQEILIKHLQKQVCDLHEDGRALSVSRKREDVLQKRVAKLLEELREAKESHSPEMKQFFVLTTKIKHMEARHSQREHELQQIIKQTHVVANTEQDKEVEKWKKLVQQKNVELEKFRTELDAILNVLQVLQRQGVVIPTSSSENTNTGWKS
ncbi:centrosomal protein of 162 kDa [Pelodytes ibericus]